MSTHRCCSRDLNRHSYYLYNTEFYVNNANEKGKITMEVNSKKTENTEKQGLSYEIKQPFIGNINGVFVGNAEVFYATIDILQSIERTKNIPMHDEEFTDNLVEIIQKMSNKNDHFNYSEMLEATYANLTSSPTLKDFKIVDCYEQNPENSPAYLLNLMMKDGYYEYLKPKADIRVNTSDKV